jgi:hypothetical protein
MGTIPPKQFQYPGQFGQSMSPNLVQEAQTAPQIQGPSFAPLTQPQPQPAQTQQATQALPDYAQDDPITQQYRNRYGAFYGGREMYQDY